MTSVWSVSFQDTLASEIINSIQQSIGLRRLQFRIANTSDNFPYIRETSRFSSSRMPPRCWCHGHKANNTACPATITTYPIGTFPPEKDHTSALFIFSFDIDTSLAKSFKSSLTSSIPSTVSAPTSSPPPKQTNKVGI
jgi:hypothetical protein